MKLPKYVHKKTAKGRTYYYFDTGARDERGRRILARLPDIRKPEFGRALQDANRLRTQKTGPQHAKTFDWLVRLYERSPEWRRLSESSKRLYSRHLGYANDEFRNGQGRSAPLSLLTAEHLVTLRDKHANAPGTANAILKAVGSAYAWARTPGRKYVRENIAAGIEQLETGEHIAWPEPLVEEALADPEVRLPVALLYFVGQRIGDTVRMGPQNIVRGVMHVTQQKTGKSLKITVHERLAAIIEMDAPKSEMVFLMGERGKPISAQGLRARLKKWLKARGRGDLVPHGLRRSAVNSLLASGCSTAEVSAITGQSLQMIEHYAKERDSAELSASAILKFEARNRRGTDGQRENAS